MEIAADTCIGEKEKLDLHAEGQSWLVCHVVMLVIMKGWERVVVNIIIVPDTELVLN